MTMLNRHSFSLSLMAAVLLLGCAVQSSWAQPKLSALKIGVLLDLSGKGQWVSSLSRAGAEMAVADLKNTGTNAQLILEDSMSDTKTAVNAMNKLLLVDSVHAVYVDFSHIAVAVAPLAAQAKRLMIYNGGAISPAHANSNVFKTSVDFFQGCRRLAEHWRKQGFKNIGISMPSLESTELCYDGAKEIYPDIAERNHNYGEALAGQALYFKNKGVEAVISSAFEIGLKNLMKAFSDLNMILPIGDLQSNATVAILREHPDLAEQITTYGFPDYAPQFRKLLEERNIELSSGNTEFAAMAYTHIKQLARALAACKGDDGECQSRQLSLSPPDSTFGFQAWQNRIAQVPIVLRKWDHDHWMVIE